MIHSVVKFDSRDSEKQLGAICVKAKFVTTRGLPGCDAAQR